MEVDERVVLEQESCELQLNTSIDTTSTDEKVGGEGRGDETLADKYVTILNACMYTLHYTKQVNLACINSCTLGGH